LKFFNKMYIIKITGSFLSPFDDINISVSVHPLYVQGRSVKRVAFPIVEHKLMYWIFISFTKMGVRKNDCKY
jgi:hypothetical protein